MSAAERQGLAAALGETEPELARWLAEPEASLEPRPAPFFRRLRLYQVIYRTPHHPLGFHVAWAPGEPAYLLTGEPQNFVAAALADGVSLESPDLALAYALAYLETTAPDNELFYVVESPAGLRFYPDPSPAEQERIRAFLARYAAIITPPAARPAGDDWAVTVFTVRQQALERLNLRVRRFGSVELSGEALEGGLPVVFAAR